MVHGSKGNTAYVPDVRRNLQNYWELSQLNEAVFGEIKPVAA
jgi:hypothetical protein